MSVPRLGPVTIKLADRIVIARVDELRAEMAVAETSPEVTIDLSKAQAIDTAGAWLIIDVQNKVEERGGRCDIIGASQEQSELIDVVRHSIPEKEVVKKPRHGIFEGLERVGKATWLGIQKSGRNSGFSWVGHGRAWRSLDPSKSSSADFACASHARDRT